MPEPAAAETGSSEPEPTPLVHPADGVPPLSVTVGEIAAAAQLLGRGQGPFAVDAERASGFRYSNRAYLIQIRRAGAGTVLIDPVSHGADPLSALRPVADVLGADEWILHSADQDLPCLAEVGLHPPKLYDTELAGRLAGFDRVNLATMVERLLGFGLAKGHGAADWSRRPLPAEWLNYAALDVELLIELREAISGVLAEQGKTDWAAKEFDYVRSAGPRELSPAARRDRWRRTSGIHRVRDRRALAAVRELWTTRERIAERRDVAPRRVLPDSAIVDAAVNDPKTVDELVALPVFGGRNQRRSAATWLAALEAARNEFEPAGGCRAAHRAATGGAVEQAQTGGRRAAGGGACGAGGGVEASGRAHREPGLARPGATALLGLGAPARSGRGRRRLPARRSGAGMAARPRGSGAGGGVAGVG